jgi:hypothetical protein
LKQYNKLIFLKQLFLNLEHSGSGREGESRDEKGDEERIDKPVLL